MSLPNIDDLTAQELRELAKKVEERTAEKNKEDLYKIYETLEQLAEEYGFEITFVIREMGEIVANKKSAPKYRNPDNPKQTWTGQGRKPNWLRDILEQNPKMTEDDFLIDKPAVQSQKARKIEEKEIEPPGVTDRQQHTQTG
jgi:DNA-binding protein H-NS